jgi:hypothetical protein
MTNDDGTNSDGPDEQHRIPDGVDDATVAALGKLSEGLETIEHARGLLYGFHRMSGAADLAIGEAVDMLRNAGHTAIADRIEQQVVGLNTLPGRWTFQVVEEYDDGYYAAVKDAERRAREELVGGRRHLFEAAMKEDRRTHGLPGHEATPDERASSDEPVAG